MANASHIPGTPSTFGASSSNSLRVFQILYFHLLFAYVHYSTMNPISLFQIILSMNCFLSNKRITEQTDQTQIARRLSPQGRVRPLRSRHLETLVTRHATCGGRVRPPQPRHPKTSPLAGSSVIRSEDPTQRPNHRGRVRPLPTRHLETPVTRHATCGGRVRPPQPRHPKTSPLAGSSVIRSEDPTQRPNHRGRVRPLPTRHLETPVTRHATGRGRVRPPQRRHPKTSPLAGSSVIRSEDPTQRPNHRGRVRPLPTRHLETPVTRHATCRGRVRPPHPRHPKTSPLANSSVIRSEDSTQSPTRRGRVRPLLSRHLRPRRLGALGRVRLAEAS
jgi:hypothetical protein